MPCLKSRTRLFAPVRSHTPQRQADSFPSVEAVGMFAPTLTERQALHDELQEATPAGAARRQRLQTAMAVVRNIYQAVGTEMNQRYEGSNAIYFADEKDPRPDLPEDPIKQLQISTYPGSRLPHAWLNTKVPGKQISTQDLAGHGVFSLFTGHGGDAWRTAAAGVSKVLGVEIKVWAIGWALDYEDVYWDYAKNREVGEDGCVLVRPDRFVAWRAMGMVEGCDEKLLGVMWHVFGKVEGQTSPVVNGVVNGH